MLNTKEMLFFLLILILIIVSNRAVSTFTPKTVDKDLMTVIGAFITTMILIVIYKSISLCDSCDTFTLSKGFTVTPEKLCEGGEYMRTSAPKEIQEMCAKYGNKSCIDCSPGFHGQPVHFEYTPMSDDNWQNQMCD